MKVLLLGGTGAMGRYLAPRLVKKGYQVSITSRKTRNPVENIEFIKLDAQLPELIEHLKVKKYDAIVDFMVYRTDSFANRIDELLKNTSHYVFISSARVFANQEGEIDEHSKRLIDEKLDPNYLSSDEYAIAKAKQENLLKSHENKNWTIVRPYITYSPDRLQLGFSEKEDWLQRALLGKPVFLYEEVMNKNTTLTYGDDVAKFLCELLGKNFVFAECYNVTGSKHIKWKEVLSIYTKIVESKINQKVKVIYLTKDKFSWHKHWEQIDYDRSYDRQFNNDKVKTLIDVNDFLLPEVGLKECLDGFLKSPRFLNINWASEAKKDKLCNYRNKLSLIPGSKNKVKYFLYRYIL